MRGYGWVVGARVSARVGWHSHTGILGGFAACLAHRVVNEALLELDRVVARVRAKHLGSESREISRAGADIEKGEALAQLERLEALRVD